MRLCCLGDIHYGGDRGLLSRVAELIQGTCSGSDIVVVVGDLTSSGGLSELQEVLSTIVDSAGGRPVLVVPGNHDLYVVPGRDGEVDSLWKLRVFNRVVRSAGAVPLMEEPYIVDGVGFVGSIGWYDYSFAPDWLGLTTDDYRVKAFGLSVWADRDHVRLPYSDEEFTLILLERLESQLHGIAGRVERVVAVLHHVPFRELVAYRLTPSWDYFAAFMGSEAIGHILEKYGVGLVLYGHQHDGVETGRCRTVRGIRCCNCATPAPIVVKV